MEKIAFWVKNLPANPGLGTRPAPVNQFDLTNRPLSLPVGAVIPIYDKDLKSRFLRYQADGRCEVYDSEKDFKIGEQPIRAAAVIQDTKPEESHALDYVEVMTLPENVTDNALECQIKLGDGTVKPLAEILEGLKQRGDLKFKRGGGITMFPGTDSQVTYEDAYKLVEALQTESGLLKPPVK